MIDKTKVNFSAFLCCYWELLSS